MYVSLFIDQYLKFDNYMHLYIYIIKIYIRYIYVIHGI